MVNLIITFIKLLAYLIISIFILRNIKSYILGKIQKKKIMDIKFTKLVDFIKYKIWDIKHFNKDNFPYFGLRMYSGRQGSGKTTAMVEWLEYIRQKYPKCLIVTNFDYKYQHYAFEDWKQFFDIRNGLEGVVFAIDELQNEWSNASWKDFPEELLTEITQQRKQRIQIIASSQVFGRVVKPLREQCYEVVECATLAGRWTFLKCFDADDYNSIIDNPSPEKKFKLRKKWRKNFIHTNSLRSLYDSYAKVERMKNKTFVRDKVRYL